MISNKTSTFNNIIGLAQLAMNGAVYINIVSIFIIPVNNMHFSHLVKVRKNSHSLSLQAFLTHSHSLSLSLAGLTP